MRFYSNLQINRVRDLVHQFLETQYNGKIARKDCGKIDSNQGTKFLELVSVPKYVIRF